MRFWSSGGLKSVRGNKTAANEIVTKQVLKCLRREAPLGCSIREDFLEEVEPEWALEGRMKFG